MKRLVKSRAAGREADDRHHDVGDEGVDDPLECGADDDADGEIDDVAFGDELAELVQHGGPPPCDSTALQSGRCLFP